MRALRWNWLWYLPLIVVCFLQALFDLVEGLRCGWTVLTHWHWSFLLSPAAALWFASTCGSIFIPLQPLVAIPAAFSSHKGKTRYLASAFSISLALAGVLVSWVLIWGAFPLDLCADGTHLRFIPFLPWPCTAFF